MQLALTGMQVREVTDTKEAEDVLEPLLQSDSDVLIVQEAFKEEFSQWFRDRLARHRGRPLIAYCPTFEKADSEVDAYLASVLRPAIGYEIRLE